MSKRISRRERRRRLYFLGAIMARAQAMLPEQPMDWPTMFGTDAATFARWIAQEEPVAPWILKMGTMGYRIPEPTRSWMGNLRFAVQLVSPALWWWAVLAVVVLGIAGVLLLAR